MEFSRILCFHVTQTAHILKRKNKNYSSLPLNFQINKINTLIWSVIKTSWTKVYYLGNPWGFIIKSGQMPRSENGKSSCWIMVPQTPFCPCLLLNLSPTWRDNIRKKESQPKIQDDYSIHNKSRLETFTSGLRVCRIKNLILKLLFLSLKRATRSTTQDSPSEPLNVCILGLYALDLKTMVSNLDVNRAVSRDFPIKRTTNLSGNPAGDTIAPLVLIGDCLFIYMSPDLIISPGEAIPSSSSIYICESI